MSPHDSSGMFDLRGKTALVTGGNGGIGLGFARGFAKAGAGVVIWGRDPAKNATAARELEALGADVLAQQVDVTQEDAVDRAMAEAVRQRGRIDCVFVNAGIASVAPSIADLSSEDYHAMISVGLNGGFYTLRASARHMIDRADAGHGGSIIVCGSLAITRAVPGMAHYAAAKGGMASMMKGAAFELGRYGIRVNMVAPGFIKTALTGGPEETDLDRAFATATPLARIGAPEDFEGIAIYLASDASAFHSGDVIVIDGALSTRMI